MTDMEAVKARYPNASQWNFGTYHDGEAFYRVYDTQHVKESSRLLGYGWADARARIETNPVEVEER